MSDGYPGQGNLTNQVGQPKKKWLEITIALLAATIVLVSLTWALQLPSRLFNAALHGPQFISIVLAAALAIVYLTHPAAIKKATDSAESPNPKPFEPGVIGVALAGFSAGLFGYVAVQYEQLLFDIPYRTPELLFISGSAIVLLLEALRRSAGMPLFMIVLGFIIYAAFGHLSGGALSTREIPIERLVIYLAMDLSALFGSPVQIGMAVVVLYILLGQTLLKAGGGTFFTDVAMATVGNRPGGPAKAAIVGSALFGSISGSAVSNVTSTGIITIPLMQRAGYSRLRAGAIEAVASTGGQLTPPIMGAAAFLMAEFLSVPYSAVVVAAVFPALLYYLAMFIYAHLLAGRDSIVQVEISSKSVNQIIRRGWHFIVPFVVLFVALFYFRESASVAALWATASLIIVGMLRSYDGARLSVTAIWSSIVDTGKTVVTLFMILAAAGFLIGALNISGLGFALTLALLGIAMDNVFILLAVSAIVCIVLGMGMPTTGVYLLLATLIAPALVQAGIEPFAAHMFVLYFGLMSMITPPVAIAAFAASSISGAPPMRTGIEAMKIGWVAYVIPFMFVFSPTLLMIGQPLSIFLDVMTAIAGVFLISVGGVGWFRQPVGALGRIFLIVAGVLTIVPDSALGVPHVFDLAGAVLGAGVIIRLILMAGRQSNTG